MNLHIPNHIMRWVGPSTIVGVGICVIFSIPASHALACEPERNCLIAWVGALSGWAALFGAWMTVVVMRDQLTEQRLQTRFQLGDGLPTIAVTRYGPDFPGRLLVRLTNWNRRAIEPEQITSYVAGQQVTISLLYFRAKGFEQNWADGPVDGTRINKKIVIPGWEDRAKAPPVAEIEVHTFDPNRASFSFSKVLKIKLKIALYGEIIEFAELTTEGPIMA